jgi:nucleoside-diphosphate-sugar epimerase
MYIQNITHYRNALINIMQSFDYKRLTNSKILIIGANGLICSCIIDLLFILNEIKKLNIKVYALSRNEEYAKNRFNKYFNDLNFSFIQHDITIPLKIELIFDYIIFGATDANPTAYKLDPVGVMLSNLYGINNILSYVKLKPLRRLLFISSSEVYGTSPTKIFSENNKLLINNLNPRTCYPLSKLTAETLCLSYSEQYGKNIVIVRPSYVFGPTFKENDDRFWAQFVRSALAKEPIRLNSSGLRRRSFCYVFDCVSSIFAVLLQGENKNIYNISDDSSVLSIREFAEIISTLENIDVYFQNEILDNDVTNSTVISTSKLKSLGWKPVYDIKSALINMLNILKNS